MRYAFIGQHRKVWPVVVQCRVLKVSATGFRGWCQRQQGERRPAAVPAKPGQRLSDLALLTHIRAAFAASKQTYGWPRIWRQLRAQGVMAGKAFWRASNVCAKP